MEDAGFELRDSIAWIYGSGFPKSLDVSKAIDKAAGVEREKWPTVAMQKKGEVGEISKNRRCAICMKALASGNPCQCDRSENPITSEAKDWQGWGTALKPAFEPVVVGRKPLVGTVAENVLAWGVGGLNIDGSRIGSEKRVNTATGKRSQTVTAGGSFGGESGGYNFAPGNTESVVQGRWPANVILDEVSAGLLDEQSGENPSRFFYQAKASKRDRNEGLEELEGQTPAFGNSKGDGLGRGISNTRQDIPRQNFHPTVKPTQLMRYLIKLVTPPGGVVLDPFTGSGSTGKAALLDGFQFVGAELTEEYLPIIEGRLKWASEQVEDEDDTLF